MNNLYLPEYAAQLVQRPGSVVGKGGNPHQYLVDGEKYQRVTTILDATVPKPALIPWATRTGVEKMAQMVYDEWGTYYGEDNAEYVNKLVAIALAEPDRVKDAAADWGTEAHSWIQLNIEAQLQNAIAPAPIPEYEPTLTVFNLMADNLDIDWMATEMIVWSNTLRVAGTVDAVGQLPDGSWILMDWKTGEWKSEWVKKYKSGFYWPGENALQLAAYSAMFTKVTGHPVSQAWVVRFPRNQPESLPCPEQGRGPYQTNCVHGRYIIDEAGDDYLNEVCPVCNGTGTIPAPGFEARQVANLESAALHYEMLVDHFRWLKQRPWLEAE